MILIAKDISYLIWIDLYPAFRAFLVGLPLNAHFNTTLADWGQRNRITEIVVLFGLMTALPIEMMEVSKAGSAQ